MRNLRTIIYTTASDCTKSIELLKSNEHSDSQNRESFQIIGLLFVFKHNEMKAFLKKIFASDSINLFMGAVDSMTKTANAQVVLHISSFIFSYCL